MGIFKNMKRLVFLIVFLISPFVFAQEVELVPVPDIPAEIIIDGDTLSTQTMPEIYIGVDREEEKYKRDMLILRNRLRRVYPYALATAENLVILNTNLEKIPTKKEKKKYIKRSQKYLEGQFKEKLKKLSRNDGKILLKLIDRQTGETAYDLIKEFKSGWTAFWSNATARTFSLNLKSEYHPETNLEDFYIETQLQYLFFRYELERSNGKNEINFNQLRLQWQEKISDEEFFPLELRE